VVNFSLLLLALPVCIADLNSLIIPNIYTKILLYITFIDLCFFGFGSFHITIISIALLMSLLMLGTGMGDIKLLGLILATHPYDPFEFTSVIFLFALVHIVVLAGLHRRIPAKIPLAPSIFAGLVTYLATR
jgi:Flp pilus assembly protein protease CpaA